MIHVIIITIIDISVIDFTLTSSMLSNTASVMSFRRVFHLSPKVVE